MLLGAISVKAVTKINKINQCLELTKFATMYEKIRIYVKNVREKSFKIPLSINGLLLYLNLASVGAHSLIE